MAEEIHVEVEGGRREPQRRGGLRWFLIVPGLFFIGFGVLVIAVPEVITAMVASVFLLIGLGLLIGGLKRRRASGRGTFFFDGHFRSE